MLTTKACRRMTHDRQAIVCFLRQFQTCCCDILIEVLDGGSSWDRHDNFRSLEEPRQCNLKRSRLQLVRNFSNCFVCFFGLTEWSPRKKCNVVLLTVIDDEVGFTVSKTVTVLDRDDRHNPASTLDVLSSYIRERHMTDLAVLTQPGQSFHGSLEGDCVVGSVKLIDIDAVQPQALQTSFERLSEMFRAGIVRPLAWTRAFPSPLCRDDETGWIWVECLRDQLLRCPRSIGVCSVNQIDVEFDRPPQRRKRCGFIDGGSPYAGSCDAHRAIAHTVHCEIADGYRPGGSG